MGLVLLILLLALVGPGLLTPASGRLTVRISEPGSYQLTTREIPVVGRVSLPGQVNLSVNDIPVAGTDTKTGDFRFNRIPLRPGLNRIVVTAHAGVWPRLEATNAVFVTLIPDPPTQPHLYPPATPVTSSPVAIRGAADPDAQIVVSVDGADVTTVTADRSGLFRADVTLPGPGLHIVRATAHSAQGSPSAAAPPLSVTLEPNWSPPRRSRHLGGVLSYAHLDLTAAVSLWKGDPAAVSLLTGRMTLSEFLDEEFSGLTVNGTPIAFVFQDAAPHISIGDSTVTVEATARPPEPILAGSLAFTGPLPFPLEDGDKLAVSVRDYRITGQLPLPATSTEQVATWTGPSGEVQDQRGVTIDLAPDRLSRSLLALSPYELVPREAASLVGLGYTLLFAIPFLWTVELLRRNRGDTEEQVSLVTRQRRIARRLLALAFVGPLWTAASELGFYLRPTLVDRLFTTPSGLKFATSFEIYAQLYSAIWLAGIAGLAAGLMGALQSKAGRRWVALRSNAGRRWIALLIDLFQALREAALLGIFVSLALMILIRTVLADVGYQLVAWLAIIPLMVSLLASAVPVLERIASRRMQWLLGVVLCAVLLALAYPLETPYTSLGGGLDQVSLARLDVESFLYQLQPLLPYFLLAALIVISVFGTAEVTRDQALILGVGTILFSAYVVGTTPNLFLIPIPWLLALWLLRRFVLRPRGAIPAQRDLVDRVVGHRPQLLEQMGTSAAVSNAASGLDAINKKLAAGDISPAQYEQRRRELSGFIKSHGQEAEPGQMNPRAAILAAGPYVADRQNGLWALIVGAAITVPWVVVNVLLVVPANAPRHNPYLPLWLVAEVVGMAGVWLAAAFFFGYFYPYFNGISGLQKGLRIGLVAVTCLLPLWILTVSGTEILVVAVRALQTVFFFTALGLLFDYAAYRQAAGAGFSWARFASFGDMTSLTAASSVALASVGLALTSVLTGQLTALATLLLKAATGQPPTTPPIPPAG